jgi:3-dehydroquinate dehydratase/shikimate dehydrogenase
MHPNMDAAPFEKEWLKRTCLVFDTVYNPEQTLLIKHAREKGCPTVTGIDMFVRQAAKQFELFTGNDPDFELFRYEVKRAISAAKY